MDDGFTYAIPDGTGIEVGSRVRVRVSGRTVKGFVTAVIERPENRELLDVASVIGNIPSFGEGDLVHLRWCATHYVAPLSVILRRTIPPNIPRRPEGGGDVASIRHARTGNDDAVTQIVARPPYGDRILHRIAPVIAGGGTVVVVAPTVVEVDEIAAVLSSTMTDTVVTAHSQLNARQVTRAWIRAATVPGMCVVGTREIMLWSFAGVEMFVVVEDARRVMRSPSTPTLGVREVIMRRASEHGIPVTFVAPLASLEVLALRPSIEVEPGRQWPLVEIADRGEEPPTSSPVMDRTREAVAGIAKRGDRVFVLVPRRGQGAVLRCIACGTVRRCRTCGAAMASDDPCVRCGARPTSCARCEAETFRSMGAGRGNVIADLSRSVGTAVGDADAGRLVTVGTERDLVGASGMALAVAIDVDGMSFAPNYRAGEDALRLLVRLAHTLEPGRGHRCLVQTSDPHQPVLEAFRTGKPAEFLRGELAARRRSAFPPFGALIALEVTGEDPTDLVRSAIGGRATVRGPAQLDDRHRWLIHGRNLEEARVALRPVVATLRDRGAKVRVDVDPHDL